MEEVVQAAKDANAHDFIVRLPNKYETKLGERGALLSGGERQRISVARAFLKDAPICILDEPTSSIDSRTESVILDSLERLMVGRTTFMIAHRLSTVRNADLILVLNHGRLVEQGTHDELLRRASLYQQLHIAQTGQAQHKERLERFERLELSVQEASMNAGHVHAADVTKHNGRGEVEPTFAERETRPAPVGDALPARGPRQPAERGPVVAREPHRESEKTEQAPTTRSGGFYRIIRARLWLIVLMAVVSAGLATGFALVVAPQYGASVLALVTGLALLAGLVLGVGAAFLLEYVSRRSRDHRRPNLPSAAQGSSDRESSES
jgi:hypothetical protein